MSKKGASHAALKWILRSFLFVAGWSIIVFYILPAQTMIIKDSLFGMGLYIFWGSIDVLVLGAAIWVLTFRL